MTTTLAVNDRNDIFIGADGALALGKDLAAVTQVAEQAAKAQLSEMIYAMDKGMPTLDLVWSGTPNLAMYEAYLRKTLMSVKGVNKIQSLTVSVDAGVLHYSAELVTIYGETLLNG